MCWVDSQSNGKNKSEDTDVLVTIIHINRRIFLKNIWGKKADSSNSETIYRESLQQEVGRSTCAITIQGCFFLQYPEGRVRMKTYEK